MTDARRWRRSLSPALCVVVAMSALGVDPVPAKAQMRRCAEHALQSTDQHRLLAVAQVALPAGIALEAPDVCRNPGHASAWLSTTHQASADTVTRWWTLICDRDQRLWICERPELHQQVERDVAIADHPIHLLIDGRRQLLLPLATIILAGLEPSSMVHHRAV